MNERRPLSDDEIEHLRRILTKKTENHKTIEGIDLLCDMAHAARGKIVAAPAPDANEREDG